MACLFREEVETPSFLGAGYLGSEHFQQASGLLMHFDFGQTEIRRLGMSDKTAEEALALVGFAEVPRATRSNDEPATSSLVCPYVSSSPGSWGKDVGFGVKATTGSLWQRKAAWALPVLWAGCRLELEHRAATASEVRVVPLTGSTWRFMFARICLFLHQ